MSYVVALDTETGGFSVNKNPLLSLGSVIASEDDIELGYFYRRCLPPVGTVFELPPDMVYNNLRFVDVYTGQYLAEVGERCVIGWGAAKVNGYVDLTKLVVGTWTEPEWHVGAGTYQEILEDYIAFLDKFDAHQHLQIFHNKSFDLRFLNKWMPHEVWSNASECTMTLLGKYNKAKNLEGKSLGDLRKCASIEMHDVKKEHTALQDARDALYGYFWLKSINCA